MGKMYFEREWLKHLLFDGWEYEKPILVSGPGGSGKPLIGNFFADEWLRKGGSVIFMTASTSIETHRRMMKYLGCDVEKYEEEERVFYIELSPEIEEVEEISKNSMRANYVKPEVWDKAIDLAGKKVKKDGELGTLITSASLNLLFFSKTYGEKMYEKLISLVRGEDKSYFYVLTLNSDAYKDWARALEEAAYNLLLSGMNEEMKLTLKVVKMHNVGFQEEEVIVPLTKEIVMEIKKEAESGRTNLIPLIRKL
ncbi:ATPase domain-containing protein [Caldanaerobacter sp.]|uniref:ATPase domain-containing protein n=1 Tax=Caldanaerobacter sp. TaxID=2930036 RepID=UPI003C73FB56